MTARVLTTVATLAWLATGLVAGRVLVQPPVGPTDTDAAALDVVAVVGLAEQAAHALAVGGDAGARLLATLPRVPGVAPPTTPGVEHYVEDVSTTRVTPDGDAWVVRVRVVGLVATDDGWAATPGLAVSVPVALHRGAPALAGAPLPVPVDDTSTDHRG